MKELKFICTDVLWPVIYEIGDIVIFWLILGGPVPIPVGLMSKQDVAIVKRRILLWRIQRLIIFCLIVAALALWVSVWRMHS